LGVLARVAVISVTLALPLAAGALPGCGMRDERIDVSRYVSIYPGSPVVEMPGATAPMKVVVRNISTTKLTALRLEVKSDACTASVQPAQIAEIIPGDRKTFAVELRRQQGKAAQRHPMLLTLHAQGLPVPAGVDLMVDLSPPPEKGWITVGQVQLIGRPQSSRALYYVAAGAPLLFLIGWLLWRWSRPRKAPAGDSGSGK
jgi:hypothetical protein